MACEESSEFVWIRLVQGIFFYFLIVWIRIRIRNTNPDPFSNTDTNPQKWL